MIGQSKKYVVPENRSPTLKDYKGRTTDPRTRTHTLQSREIYSLFFGYRGTLINAIIIEKLFKLNIRDEICFTNKRPVTNSVQNSWEGIIFFFVFHYRFHILFLYFLWILWLLEVPHFDKGKRSGNLVTVIYFANFSNFVFFYFRLG